MQEKLEKREKSENPYHLPCETAVCIFEGKSVKSMCRTEYGKGNEGEERKEP